MGNPGWRRLVAVIMSGIVLHGAGAVAPASSFATRIDNAEDSGAVAITETPEYAPRTSSEAEVEASAETGERVELPEERSIDSRTFRNADGTFTTEVHGTPIHYKDAGGSLKPIETEPVASRAHGVAFETKAAATRTSLGSSSATGALVTVSNADHSVSFRPATPALLAGIGSAADRAPEVEDDRVYYRDVYPDVDLRYALFPHGVKEDIILKAPTAPSTFAYVLDAPGLSPVLIKDGSLELRDGEKAIFQLPAPFMVDSTPEEDGDGVRSTDVTYELLTVGTLTLLIIEADKAWLADPKRVYPVYVDPTINDYTTQADTFISSAYPNTSFNAQWNPNEGGYYELWNGKWDASSGVNYAFIKTGIPSNVTVLDADFHVYVQHAASGGTATQLNIARLTSAFTTSQTWNMTHPSFSHLTHVYAADNSWANYNVTSTVQSWVSGTTTNYGFRISPGSSTLQSQWKRLRASENYPTNDPYLTINWTKPSATAVSPTAGAWTKSSLLDWNFAANGSSYAQTKFHAQVSTSSTTWSGTALKANSGEVSSSATAWTAPTTNLVNGTTYYWRVKVFDGHSWSAWTSAASFKRDVAAPTPPPSPQPLVTVGGAITAEDPVYYDLGNGTFTVKIRGTDAHSGIKVTSLRLTGSDGLTAYHDWSGSSTNCTVSDPSTLMNVTACSRTYNSSGTREVQFTVVGLGQSHTSGVFYALTDTAGNRLPDTSYSDTGKDLVFDATVPTGSIAQPAAGATVTGSVAITGTASDTNFLKYEVHYGAGESPSIWLDVGQNPRLTSVTNGTLASWDTTGLAAGTYTLRLRVYDKARVSSGYTTVTRTVTVDPGPPTAVITSPTDDAFVAGQVDISGTASTASGFEAYTLHYGEGCSPTVWLDIGANPRTTAVSDGLLGGWNASPLSGEHAIRLVVSKTDDTTSTSTVCVTVDNQPPAAPEVTASGELVYQAGANDPVYFGPAGTLTLTATSVAGPSGLSRIRFEDPAPATGWTPSPTLPNDDTSAPYAQDLAIGSSAQSATIEVSARSGAGVDSATTLLSLVRDDTPPQVTWQSPTAFAITNDTDAEVAWTDADAGSGVASRLLQRQRAPILFAGSCTGVVWEDDGSPVDSTSPVAQTMVDGYCYRWSLAVADRIGNTATVTSAPVLVDTSPPTADFATPDEGTAAGSGSSSLMVNWTDADAASGVAQRELRRQVADKLSGACAGVTWVDDGLVNGPTSPLLVEDLTPDRCYRWVLALTDAAGNAAEHTSGVAALDKVTLASPLAQAAFFDIETLEAGTASPGPVSVEFLVDGVSIGTSTSAPFAVDWDTTAVADGPHTLQLRATYSRGPAFESTILTVQVANALNPSLRVAADANAGRITIDERALWLVHAAGTPHTLSPRYHGPLASDGSASTSLDFLRDWDSLSQGTRDEILAFLDEPWRGPFYETPDTAPIGAADPDFADCGVQHNTRKGPIIYCLTETDHFSIKYYLEGDWHGGVPRTDVNNNDVPDYIDDLELALEDAWDTYAIDLGYAVPAPGLVPVIVHGALTRNGQALPPGPFSAPIVEIRHDLSEANRVATARHELFHYFQYAYLDWGDLGASYGEQWFWLEATAEWAAHQAQLDGTQQDGLDQYYQNLGEYLGRPQLRFDLCECPIPNVINLFVPPDRRREYGAFIFAEYLEQRFADRAVVRETWEQIALNQLADEAIDDMAATRGSSLRQLLNEFAAAAYLMDFNFNPPNQPEDDLINWITELQQFGDAHPDEYTGADNYGGPRPFRQERTLVDSLAENGSLPIDQGGFSYVELRPLGVGSGQLDLRVSREADEIDARVLLLDRSTIIDPTDYPAICDEQVLTFEDDVAAATFEVNDGCATHAVLVLVHGDPLSGGFFTSKTVDWEARFDTGRLSNGTVELGLNPEGYLGVAGDTPSSTGNQVVALRRVFTQDEGFNGCICEGWGVADTLTGTSGAAWVNRLSDGPVIENLELVDYEKVLDTMVSRVRAGDALEVTHDIAPASGTDFLFEWTVTIENTSDDPVDLRYRRVMDWDIDPTPLNEFVTVDTFGGQAVPALAFSSNDGFAWADPLDGPSDLGQIGFFTDAGPDDHGAMFDFDFGLLAPGATRSFTLWYGAAPGSGDALTALGIVGAELYSFGKSTTPEGTPDDDSTVFIFGFRDDEAEPLGSFSAQGTESDADPSTPQSRPGVNRNQSSGSGG